MNYINFLKSKNFINAYKDSQACLFTNIDMPDVSWDEVLNFVNTYKLERIGKDIVPSPHAFLYNQAQRISSVNKFVKEVYARFNLVDDNDVVLTCQLLGTTIVENGTFVGKHQDIENNIFWQGEGKSRWRLYDSMENNKPFLDVVLEKNDLLYVPSNTVHEVDPIGPRFGFAILFGERNNYDN